MDSTTGPIRHADLMAGQFEDRRVDDGPWTPVEIVEHDLGALTSSPAPPVRRIETITTPLGHPTVPQASGRRPRPEHQRLDARSPISARPAPTSRSCTANRSTRRATSRIDHLGVGGLGRCTGRSTGSCPTGIAGDAFEPRHTTHGFQYVQVEGAPGPLTPMTTSPASSSTPTSAAPGGSDCSDERLNRSTRSPTGASATTPATSRPTARSANGRAGPATGRSSCRRPRSSTTSPGSPPSGCATWPPTNAPTALVPNFVPDPTPPDGSRERRSRGTLLRLGRLGRCRACSCRGSCTAPTATDGSSTSSGRRWWRGSTSPPSAAAPTATPPAHRDAPDAASRTRSSSGTRGFHWGEWREPAIDRGRPLRDSPPRPRATSPPPTCTARRRSAAEVARLLGRRRRRARYDELADERARRLATRVPRRRRHADARHARPTTSAPSRSAWSPTSSARSRAPTGSSQLIRAAGTHLGTGFLATPFLLPVLADPATSTSPTSCCFQDTAPSWLTMIDRGATTSGRTGTASTPTASPTSRSTTTARARSSRSCTATSPASGSGRRDVAYRRFRIEPRPGRRAHFRRAVHDSPYGRIESSWRIDANVEPPTFELTTTVPPGTDAEVRLPDGTPCRVGPGITLTTAHSVDAAPTGGSSMGELDGKIAVITGAGSGIGRATAEAFVREGALVLGADVSGRQEETATRPRGIVRTVPGRCLRRGRCRGDVRRGDRAIRQGRRRPQRGRRLGLTEAGRCDGRGLPSDHLGEPARRDAVYEARDQERCSPPEAGRS